MLGFNTGYVEELYKRFLKDPASVSSSWRDFFADYEPSASFTAVEEARPVVDAPTVQAADEKLPAGVDVRDIRGPAAKLVDNMEASLSIPTATSVRTVPVKLLTENRAIINEHQRAAGGLKVSFTHIIAYAVVNALMQFPGMRASFRRADNKPQQVRPGSVNLGLAMDIERRGRRSLIVPTIRDADQMNFAQFLGIYNDLVRRGLKNRLQLSDFADTTATLTNPGMIGTTMSVPRLMPRQGVIIGVGAISYPPEYQALPPEAVSRSGLSQVMSVTSTYDHRIIQGAESGAFLSWIAALLLGDHSFYSGIIADLQVPYPPFVRSTDSTPLIGRSRDGEMDMIQKQAQVMIMIRVFRVRGHLQANTNPLGYEWKYHPELDPAKYGLTVWDLDRQFVTGGLGGKHQLPLRDILRILRATYTRRIGVAFMHISDPMEKKWLQDRIEPTENADTMSTEGTRYILQRLNAAEAFERFLHTRYIGQKRFSLEGGESLIPMVDAIVTDAAQQEVHEIVIGMAHRGRLNVLANILGKSYESIFSEFEGNLDPDTIYGSGDVKYHLGASGTYTSVDGNSIDLTLASNPSHLESVSPVVQGMVRAKQDQLRASEGVHLPGGDVHDAVIPLLIHGDAAFAGQGVVAETFNLSQLQGYHTGGSIHIVVNNQIGFTTGPTEARSSTYATDVARLVEAPIFHVNGDDPEACVRVARLALDYRQVFNKDVVIDMLCYRQHGHNEGDEPTYTNPLLYGRIDKKRSPRKLYTEALLTRGAMTLEEAEQQLDSFQRLLQEAFERTTDLKTKDPSPILDRYFALPTHGIPEADTRASSDDITATLDALVTVPEDFKIHPKLLRQMQRRDRSVRRKRRVDWALAEALAIGTLLLEGTPVRLSGQDSRRATFSQRHAVWYDQGSGNEHIVLNHIRPSQTKLAIFDSLLSEFAVLGFEYGYSVAHPAGLVIWEAQFGDFSNGAQIIFDQFLSAAEEKWYQRSSLVVLLPHGYEGQGPEHSSARLERFLQLCAEDNMIVCNFSVPANYFHALRRQVRLELKKPLIVMTPKSLLRHAAANSGIDELARGTFLPVIGSQADPDKVQRLAFCTGKVYYDLVQALDADPEIRECIAVVRVEQLYPFPEMEIRAQVATYAKAKDVFWVQEEPANMGAWSYIRHRLDSLLDEHMAHTHTQYAGRVSSASPATGSAMVHALEQTRLVNQALTL